MGFCSATGRIDFLGVHPQFRAQGASERLLEAVRAACPAARELCLTTFRERDPADPGMRREWLRLGFEPAELLWEFGYPTQRMVLPAARLP